MRTTSSGVEVALKAAAATAVRSARVVPGGAWAGTKETRVAIAGGAVVPVCVWCAGDSPSPCWGLLLAVFVAGFTVPVETLGEESVPDDDADTRTAVEAVPSPTIFDILVDYNGTIKQPQTM